MTVSTAQPTGLPSTPPVVFSLRSQIIIQNAMEESVTDEVSTARRYVKKIKKTQKTRKQQSKQTTKQKHQSNIYLSLYIFLNLKVKRTFSRYLNSVEN